MPLVDSSPHDRLKACVVVPAKNEAQHLVSTLDALYRQVGLDWSEYEVILLINNSKDESFLLADHYRRAHPRFRLHIINRDFGSQLAHIGNIRRMLMDEACLRLQSVKRPDGLILSTDADTEAEPDWIAQNLREAGRGAEAVGGRILFRASELGLLDERTRTIQLLDEQYGLLVAWLEDRYDPQLHDPWPRHHQNFGGSLAVTARVYERVGGLPPERMLEDVAFYRLLLRNDVKFRHSTDVRVRTSPRLHGRTEVGLAEQLTRWAEDGRPVSEISVASVPFLGRLFTLRRQFRRLWAGKGSLKGFSRTSGIKEAHLTDALQCATFGAAFELLDLPNTLRTADQPLVSAVEELQDEFSSFGGVPSGNGLRDTLKRCAGPGH